MSSDNHVVEYELNRRVGWEPEARRGHLDAASPDPAEKRWGHRWSFELTPDGPDATIVTEIYAPGARCRGRKPGRHRQGWSAAGPVPGRRSSGAPTAGSRHSPWASAGRWT